jgi:hypothetical protein
MPRELWRESWPMKMVETVSHFMPILRGRVPVGPMKNEQGRVIADKYKIADMLNNYFSTGNVFTDEDINRY